MVIWKIPFRKLVISNRNSEAAEQFRHFPSLRWLPLWTAGLSLHRRCGGNLGDPLGGPSQGVDQNDEKTQGNTVGLPRKTRKTMIFTKKN